MKRLKIQYVTTKTYYKSCSLFLKIFLLVLTVSFFEHSRMIFGQVCWFPAQIKIVKEMWNIKRLNIQSFFAAKPKTVNLQQMNTEVKHNKKTLWPFFNGWGSTASMLEPLQGGSLQILVYMNWAISSLIMSTLKNKLCFKSSCTHIYILSYLFFFFYLGLGRPFIWSSQHWSLDGLHNGTLHWMH